MRQHTIHFILYDNGLLAKLEDFCNQKDIGELHDGVILILERYFRLSYKDREELERKIMWDKHRNKGFRSLPQFLYNQTKNQTKKKTNNQTKKKTISVCEDGLK